MDGTARCGTCFRSERRRDGHVEVTMAGGGRRPDVPGDLAAWRAYRRVRAGEQSPPVDACVACGQPMFCVEGELPPLPRWDFTLPDGPIAVGADGRVIDGDDADADTRMEAHYREVMTVKLTKGEAGFAVVTMVIGGILALAIGLFDCPTLAIGMAAAAAAPIARNAASGKRNGRR